MVLNTLRIVAARDGVLRWPKTVGYHAVM